MKNWKISMKLIVSFAIVLAMAIVVGLVGIYGMQIMNDADNEMYEYNLKAITAMGRINQNYASQRIELRNCVIASTPEAMKTAEDKLGTLDKEMLALMAEYKKTITDESLETAFLNAEKSYKSDYADAVATVVAAAKISTEAGEAALVDPSVAGCVVPIAQAFQTSMDNNEKWGKEAVDGNAKTFNTLRWVQIGVLALAAAVAMFFAFYVSSLISKPLAVLTTFMNRAGSTGDITLAPADVELIGKMSQCKDEIGQCIGSTASFVNHMVVISKELGQVADGDLSIEIELLSDKDVMGVSLTKMADNLNMMFGELKTASDQVSTGADQVSHSAQELAAGSSEQAASVQQLTASVADVKGQVDENASRSEKALENCEIASNLMGDSMKSMQEMLVAMAAIDDSSKNITRVIKVIEDIAFQTNILALNAAVEAARAGQHGKGFAVVADEVRNLASKSAAAAKETAGLIEGSSKRVEEGGRIVERTNESLKAVGTSTAENAAIIRDMAVSLGRQSTSVSEINSGMDQISTVVQANSATAQQSAAAAEEMSAQAIVMNDIVARFKLRRSEAIGGSFRALGPAPSARPNREEQYSSFAGSKY